jgi:hypothetical protein
VACQALAVAACFVALLPMLVVAQLVGHARPVVAIPLRAVLCRVFLSRRADLFALLVSHACTGAALARCISGDRTDCHQAWEPAY